MPRYSVDWAKTYVASGTVEVEAESPEQAQARVFDDIGNYVGSKQYIPDYDYVQVVGEVKDAESNGD